MGRGRGTPLCRDFISVNIFGRLFAVLGGRGVPPFAVIKKFVENWPKNCVFQAKKRRFWRKNSMPLAVMGGGGGDPHHGKNQWNQYFG